MLKEEQARRGEDERFVSARVTSQMKRVQMCFHRGEKEAITITYQDLRDSRAG